MATGLVLTISKPYGNPGVTWVLGVQESFDEVADKLQPLEQLHSPQLLRQNLTFTGVDGNRRFITASVIHFVIENVDDEWL